MGLLQFTAGVFVWVTIVLSNVAFHFAAFWLYLFWQQSSAIVKGTTFGNNSTTSLLTSVGITNSAIATSETVQMLQVAFYIMAIFAGLLLLITIAMFKRIKMAVGVIKQASIAMMKMPLIGKSIFSMGKSTKCSSFIFSYLSPLHLCLDCNPLHLLCMDHALLNYSDQFGCPNL